MCMSIRMASIAPRCHARLHRLGAILRPSHARAELGEHRARDERIDLVVLGEKDATARQAAAARALRSSPASAPAREVPGDLGEERRGPDRLDQVAGRCQRRSSGPRSWRSPGVDQDDDARPGAQALGGQSRARARARRRGRRGRRRSRRASSRLDGVLDARLDMRASAPKSVEHGREDSGRRPARGSRRARGVRSRRSRAARAARQRPRSGSTTRKVEPRPGCSRP